MHHLTRPHSRMHAQEYSFEYSHWEAVQSLHDWMASQNVPGIYGIDTRALTKRLREKGCTLAKIIIGGVFLFFFCPLIGLIVYIIVVSKTMKSLGFFIR